jgi:2-methylcitrate dehydratase PrpD
VRTTPVDACRSLFLKRLAAIACSGSQSLALDTGMVDLVFEVANARLRAAMHEITADKERFEQEATKFDQSFEQKWEAFGGKQSTKDGTVIEHEVQDFPGLASRPFTWEESVEKFDRLVAGRVDEGLCQEIKDAVRSLESIQVRDLMKLLGSAKAGKPADP